MGIFKSKPKDPPVRAKSQEELRIEASQRMGYERGLSNVRVIVSGGYDRSDQIFGFFENDQRYVPPGNLSFKSRTAVDDNGADYILYVAVAGEVLGEPFTIPSITNDHYQVEPLAYLSGLVDGLTTCRYNYVQAMLQAAMDARARADIARRQQVAQEAPWTDV